MLSISPIGLNLDYYLELTTVEYYLTGGEPPGVWTGAGSRRLGLKDQIDVKEFRNLAAGFSADGSSKLVQNAGKKNRQFGWDLTFSAPKSVSVLWCVAPPKIRREIERCHQAAVAAAIDFVQETAAFSRVGKAGSQSQAADLVIGLFQHGTSRAGDPQLHIHALLLNLGIDADGTTRTIVSQPVYRLKMTIGAVYRLELAHQLVSRIGFRLRNVGFSFEVKGVPRNVCSFFSKRSQDIKEILGRRFGSSAKAAQIATLETRRKKDVAPLAQLIPEWVEQCRKLGFTEEDVKRLANQSPVRQRPVSGVRSAFRRLAAKHSSFSEHEVLRDAAILCQHQGISARRLRNTCQTYLHQSPEAAHVAGSVYTSTKNLRLEKELLQRAEEMSSKVSHPVSADILEKHLLQPQNQTLSWEQSAALGHITLAGNSVQAVSGKAGVGKTRMLKVAADVWEEAGYKVYGACVSGKAARGLQQATGIRTETVARLLFDANRSLKDAAQHQAKQLWRAARRKSTYRYQPALKLDAKSILVLDEAAMIGTQDLHQLVAAARTAGTKLVLIGDSFQLQPLAAGNPFHSLCKRLGAPGIDEIKRQADSFDRQLVTDLSEGRAKDALHSLFDRGRLHLADNRHKARTQLVADWATAGRRHDPIFAPTRSEAADINKACQRIRKKNWELGCWNHMRVGRQKFYAGDRIIFERRNRRLGLENGDFATIKKINMKRGVFTAVLDDGRKVLVPLRQYADFSLGYATTVHKGQGMTVQNAFVLLGGSMQDRFLSYVQLSRAVGETHVYLDRHEAGSELEGIVSQMNRGEIRPLAKDYATQNQDSQPINHTVPTP